MAGAAKAVMVLAPKAAKQPFDSAIVEQRSV